MPQADISKSLNKLKRIPESIKANKEKKLSLSLGLPCTFPNIKNVPNARVRFKNAFRLQFRGVCVHYLQHLSHLIGIQISNLSFEQVNFQTSNQNLLVVLFG